MTLDIPAPLAAKANKFPESSYGATTVTLILANGRLIEGVVLSGPRIVKVGGRLVSEASELDFDVTDAVDVVRPEHSTYAALRAVWQQAISLARLRR